MQRHSWALATVGVSLVFSHLYSQADLATTSAAAPIAVAVSSKPPPKPVYLTGHEKVWSDFPKSPALGSPEDQSDMQAILSVQASRTPDQTKEAFRDQHYSIKLMTDVIDPAFDIKYPHLFAMLEQANKDANFITSNLKNENARLRPYEQHPDVVHSLFATDGYSYPSGHSSGMELQAHILATLFHATGQDTLLFKRAHEIADSRVTAGVHYPSDVKEGLDLGDLLFTQLEADPQFTDALNAAAKADHLPSM